ncbi:MAG: DNA polymerase III subunit chi, partial [Gammaproteobacteria bacterium]|nr:DNA polymerase III subunit chi [Gammaproteobacteria bacterium]
CRIAEKAYRQQLSTHIHTHSSEQAEQVDELLWGFRSESFIPHEWSEQRLATDHLPPPVTIGLQPPTDSAIEVVINLAAEVPLFFSHHNRLAEIIDGNGKVAGRKRYKFYKERGYALNTHTL